jgi:hypothetical protein
MSVTKGEREQPVTENNADSKKKGHGPNEKFYDSDILGDPNDSGVIRSGEIRHTYGGVATVAPVRGRRVG